MKVSIDSRSPEELIFRAGVSPRALLIQEYVELLHRSEG